MFVTQPFVYERSPLAHNETLESFYAIHFSWKLTIGAALSFGVCALGSRQTFANRAAPTAA